LKFVLPFFIQLWMYATPVVYPLSLVPDRFKMFVALNPMVPIIELFKKAYLGAGTVDLKYIIISIVITLIVLFSGIIVFNRMEKNFMDTV
jgi:homopolymeric O-antigen transport system permease protein